MTGIKDAIKAIEIERELGEYLMPRWENLVTLMIREGHYTANDMARALILDEAQKKKLSNALSNIRVRGEVRKYGLYENARYELTEPKAWPWIKNKRIYEEPRENVHD